MVGGARGPLTWDHLTGGEAASTGGRLTNLCGGSNLERRLSPHLALNHRLVQEHYAMHVKTKAFGLFTAAVIVLSLTGGAVAQTTTEVELTEAACAPGITQVNVDFGTYVFRQSANSGAGGFVALTSTDGTASFTVRDTSSGRRANCGIQVTASALFDSSGANGINVTLKESPGGTAGNPITVTVAPGASKTVDAMIPDTLSGSFGVDTYRGTITVSDAAGS